MRTASGSGYMKSGISGAVSQLNSKTSIYRGFTILKLPRKKPYSRQRYQITHDGCYLGIDFALAEAIRTIDELRHGKKYEA